MARSVHRRSLNAAAMIGLTLLVSGHGSRAVAAEFSARDVTAQLFKLDAGGAAPDFAGRDLSELDLSGVDFKRAKLAGARMFGTDLSRSNLTGTNLSGANLDRAILISARLDGSNLSRVSMLRPTTTAKFEDVTHDGPSFAGANLEDARLFGRFRNANFSGANLTRAVLAPTNTTGFIENLWRADLSSANLSAAKLENADLTYVLLQFADLRGANLRGANLHRVDLAHADLTDADLTGADVSNADLDGVNFTGAKGLATVKGLSSAHNVPKGYDFVR